ncbi:MAG: hypothetical protein NTV01_08985 [Bacteroidia bacterium]|nr:hypothetical protein [Bacteroidia bacterium]
MSRNIIAEQYRRLKPQLTYRIGFVGHRPNRLGGSEPSLLADSMKQILAIVKDEVLRIYVRNRAWYSGNRPEFRAISSLADGSDRTFAEAAMQSGYDLTCPMPFSQEEYETDFSPANALEPDSLKRFRDLLRQAEKSPGFTRFELIGDRNQEAKAYAVCGQMILNQSDLLVIVWDGLYQNKIGGTEDMLHEALRQNIPVIWIDSRAPHGWQLLDVNHLLPRRNSGDRLVPAGQMDGAGLAEIISKSLTLPGTAESDAKPRKQVQNRLSDFYHEKMPGFNPAILWKTFRNLLGKRILGFPVLRVNRLNPDTVNVPIQGYETSGRSTSRSVMTGFAESDRFSSYYGDYYRSGYILTFLLSALAVGLALFPVAAGWISEDNHSGESVFVAAELLSLFCILFLVFRSHTRRWHSRWLDYRLTAEWIRQLIQLAPLGIGKTIHETRGHQKSYEHPSATWMAWYVRALERNLGLPHARIDESYLKKFLDNLLALIHNQETYHAGNSIVNHRIERFLHQSGIVLITATIASCSIHLLPLFIPGLSWEGGFAHLLTFLCGFLPALGAALAGINNQGEFKRLTKTSESMQRAYIELSDELMEIRQKLQTSDGKAVIPLFPLIKDLAHRVSHLMIEELSDWRITYHNRPPTLPT